MTTPPIVGKHGTMADYVRRGGEAHYVTEGPIHAARTDASIAAVWLVIRDTLDRHSEDENPSRVARSVIHAMHAAGFEIVWAEVKGG